ncbi:hypothetical protein SAMN05444277_102104 [Parafilimonas terrae]|uniref:Uncharacterized protein n=1 Tax=Parafilimonas terrae TaxID=1465490 RepID=A0A1I5TFY8_9BACT|nr:hypothetical protein SAMN05444277_102104 [Parafilimonas terrae]
MYSRFLHKKLFPLFVLALFVCKKSETQTISENIKWIRPVNEKSPAVWGIRNGIVFGLWPYDIENPVKEKEGGPRGLIRVGYEFKGHIDMINFIAVEPVVNGEMEFSEISPSRVDGKWGKLMWASDSSNSGRYYPAAISRGVITHPDARHPDVEQLSLYVFMEQFLNGAHPYLKISIRSDNPEELCFEILNEENSAPMQRCALTATMGNYSRLRLLYLKNKVIKAGELYNGFDGIDFIEKKIYPLNELLRDKNDDYIVLAETNESFASLSSWPQQEVYYARWSWRYRPFFKLTQYWKKEKLQADTSLSVRVNGRAKYWSGGSANKNVYIDIPGGVAFENFEMREKYYSGQKFYFGLTRKTPADIVPQVAGMNKP